MAQHQPEWDFYFATIENEPASIALDIALADVAPIEELPFMLWASVKLMRPDENGFPDKEEAEILAAIEDELTESVREIDAIQVGRVKSGGMQDLYFYGPTDEGFEDIVLEIMKKYPDYLFATDIAEDKDWNEYLGYLYPDHYQYQSMQNRHVIDQLQEQGDDLTALRDVDHFVAFATEAGREAFIEAVLQLGYKVISKDGQEDEALPYTVNILRNDVADWQSVDDYVWELCQLAEKHEGEYEGWGCEVVKK
jgi:uncharacterized protein (TIGR01619 family)